MAAARNDPARTFCADRRNRAIRAPPLRRSRKQFGFAPATGPSKTC